MPDAEHAGGDRERARVVLGTGFDLTADKRREDFVFVDRNRRRNLALAQAFHVVGVQRELVGGLEQDAARRRDFFFVVAGFAFDVIVPVIDLDPLPAGAQGQEQAVVKETEGIGQCHAAVAAFGVDLGVKPGGCAGAGCFNRVIDVAGRGRITGAAIGEVHIKVTGRQIDLMAHSAGMEPVAHPGHGGAHIFVTGKVPRLHGEVTGIVGHRHGMTQEVVIAFARPDGAVDHDRVVDVILGIHRPEGVLGARPAPGFCVVVANVAGVRHLGFGAYLHSLLGRIGDAFGVADVGRQPQPLAAKVQAQDGHLAINALVIPLSIAGLFYAIETQPELVLVTEPTADIHSTADLAVGGVATGELGDRLVRGALGHHVDTAAHTAPRRDAIDQLARAFEDIDAVGHFHVDGVRGQDAVEAVIGDVTVEQAETANGELLIAPARRVGCTYRGVAADQVAQGAGLQVLDRLAGVGGHAERGFHEVPRTEQALGAPTCNLPTGEHSALPAAFCAENRGAGQLQAVAVVRHGHQGVGLIAGGHQLQTGAL